MTDLSHTDVTPTLAEKCLNEDPLLSSSSSHQERTPPTLDVNLSSSLDLPLVEISSFLSETETCNRQLPQPTVPTPAGQSHQSTDAAIPINDVLLIVAILRPSARLTFPCRALDLEKQHISILCLFDRCRRNLPVFWASSKGYDLFSVCEDCHIEYGKSGKVTTKQGKQCIRFAQKQYTGRVTRPHLAIQHPYPLVRKRPERGPNPEANTSNRRIPSRGEKELQATTKRGRH